MARTALNRKNRTAPLFVSAGDAARSRKVASPVNDNPSRLSLAVQGLMAAMQEQAEVTRNFQENAEELKVAIDELSANCQQYQQTVSRLSVDGLRRKTRRLSQLMDQFPG